MATKKKHVPACDRKPNPSSELLNYVDRKDHKKRNAGGKGDKCRSFGKNYEENYDQIDWGKKKPIPKKKLKKKVSKQDGEAWTTAPPAGKKLNTTNLIT
jgi:hypothetical protein